MSEVGVYDLNFDFAHTNIFCNCLVLFIAQAEVWRGGRVPFFLVVLGKKPHSYLKGDQEPIKYALMTTNATR